MPALTDLDQRIKNVPEWHSLYESSLQRATEIARAIPLIHTAGKRVPFRELFIQHRSIPTSAELPGYHSKTTLETESAFKLSPCAYFYAGRACSEFGDVVLAFDEDRQSPYRGSATPFDTGGLFLGFIKSNISPVDLELFVNDSTSQWKLWRESLAHYLAAYFHPLNYYWEDRPGKPDPEEIFFNKKNTWRSWTVEVRFETGVPISNTTAWTSGKAAQDEFLFSLLDDVGPLTRQLMRQQIVSFRKKSISANGADDPYQVMEDWVKKTLRFL